MPRKPSHNPEPLPDLISMGQAAVSAALKRFADRRPDCHLVAVDATCGNGHDTCFLARQMAACAGVRAYSVLSFDIQQAALDAARLLTGALSEAERGRIIFLRQSHDRLTAILHERQAELFASGVRASLAAVMYNLGFLPRSDKRVTTMKDTTLASLEQAAAALEPDGLLAVHAYGGHPGGPEELEAVETWCSGLPFAEWLVMRYAACNKARNPEVLFLAWKRLLHRGD